MISADELRAYAKETYVAVFELSALGTYRGASDDFFLMLIEATRSIPNCPKVTASRRGSRVFLFCTNEARLLALCERSPNAILWLPERRAVRQLGAIDRTILFHRDAVYVLTRRHGDDDAASTAAAADRTAAIEQTLLAVGGEVRYLTSVDRLPVAFVAVPKEYSSQPRDNIFYASWKNAILVLEVATIGGSRRLCDVVHTSGLRHASHSTIRQEGHLYQCTFVPLPDTLATVMICGHEVQGTFALLDGKSVAEVYFCGDAGPLNSTLENNGPLVVAWPTADEATTAEEAPFRNISQELSLDTMTDALTFGGLASEATGNAYGLGSMRQLMAGASWIRLYVVRCPLSGEASSSSSSSSSPSPSYRLIARGPAIIEHFMEFTKDEPDKLFVVATHGVYEILVDHRMRALAVARDRLEAFHWNAVSLTVNARCGHIGSYLFPEQQLFLGWRFLHKCHGGFPLRGAADESSVHFDIEYPFDSQRFFQQKEAQWETEFDMVIDDLRDGEEDLASYFPRPNSESDY